MFLLTLCSCNVVVVVVVFLEESERLTRAIQCPLTFSFFDLAGQNLK
jgi:hypothetical protein